MAMHTRCPAASVPRSVAATETPRGVGLSLHDPRGDLGFPPRQAERPEGGWLRGLDELDEVWDGVSEEGAQAIRRLVKDLECYMSLAVELSTGELLYRLLEDSRWLARMSKARTGEQSRQDVRPRQMGARVDQRPSVGLGDPTRRLRRGRPAPAWRERATIDAALGRAPRVPHGVPIMPQLRAPGKSPNHLGRLHEDRLGDRQAESFGGLHVDCEVEPGRLLYRQRSVKPVGRNAAAR